MARRLIVGLVFLAGTEAAAQAACPTAADLQRGIRIDYSDGTAEIFRPLSEGVVKVDGIIGGELAFRMEIAQGTHLLRYEDVVQGRTVESSINLYDYGVPPLEMPVPEPGGRWQADVTVTNDGVARSEAQSQVYDTLTPIEIGACTYDRVPVLIAYDTEDGYLEGVDYLPELGIGFLAWSDTGDADRFEVEPVGISVVRK